jgi:hypothetical protein
MLHDNNFCLQNYIVNFLFSTSSIPAQGFTQPPIQWVPGALFPGVKQPGREADHSPPTSAVVKKTWIYISTPQTSLGRSSELEVYNKSDYQSKPHL